MEDHPEVVVASAAATLADSEVATPVVAAALEAANPVVAVLEVVTPVVVALEAATPVVAALEAATPAVAETLVEMEPLYMLVAFPTMQMRKL